MSPPMRGATFTLTPSVLLNILPLLQESVHSSHTDARAHDVAAGGDGSGGLGIVLIHPPRHHPGRHRSGGHLPGDRRRGASLAQGPATFLTCWWCVGMAHTVGVSEEGTF